MAPLMDWMNGRRGAREAAAARGLGWASLGIGLTELAAPRNVERLLGLEDDPERRGILRVLGVREICHGVGLLGQSRPNAALTSAVWARVAGDVLDTALLGVAATRTRHRARFAAVSALVMAIGTLDALCALRLVKSRGWT